MMTPPQLVKVCNLNTLGSKEFEIICDDSTNDAFKIAVYDSTTGEITYYTVDNDGVLTDYTPVGNARACGSTALPPQSFCFKSSDTAPQEFDGRRFKGDLCIARGFTVNSVTIGAINYALGITWGVLDQGGTDFAPALAAALQSKIPGSTVNVVPTSPIDECLVTPQCFTVTIDCIKLANAPINVDLIYDGGTDLIQNAGFEEDPLNDTFHQAKRQDNGGFIRCTGIANRGWQTNDPNQEFEHWPAGFLGVTPTPRGTGIQEVNANGTNTIWQTLVVPLAGTYTLRATVGGRGVVEQFPIRLSTGDTNDVGPGDLINAVINAPSVTGGTGTPWTNFSQNIFLNPGTYTLSLKGPTTTPAVGGLFTDLRLFTSVPNQVKSLTSIEDCTVLEDVTTNSTDCQLWQPVVDSSGTIVSWNNPKLGLNMLNNAFWAQVPSPECCLSVGGGGEEVEAVLPNLLTSYLVCGLVDGIETTLARNVIMNQSGGLIAETFVSQDGELIAPDSWEPGECLGREILICADGVQLLKKTNGAGFTSYIGPNGVPVDEPAEYTIGSCAKSSLVIGEICYEEPVSVIRRASAILCDGCTDVTVQYFDVETGLEVVAPAIVECPKANDTEILVLCDDNGTFIRRILYDGNGEPLAVDDFDLDGITPYVTVGTVKNCAAANVLLERCYEYDDAVVVSECTEDTQPRVLWENSGAWDGTNPTWPSVEATLLADTPVAFQNTQNSGIETTLTLTGATGISPDVGATSLLMTVPDGTSSSLKFDFDVKTCAVYSIRVYANVPTTVTSDAPVHAFHNTSNPLIQGDPPVIVGNDTTSVTITSPTNSRVIIEVPGSTTVTIGVNNNSGAQNDQFIGMHIGQTTTSGGGGNVTTYKVIDYTDGTQIIVNTEDPTDRPAAIDPAWTLIQCASSGGTTNTETLLCVDGETVLRTTSASGEVTYTGSNGLAVPTPLSYTFGACSNCCDNVIGNGCWTGGRYVALRSVTGTVTLFDTITGAIVPSGDVVTCATVELKTTINRLTAANFNVAAGAKSVTILIIAGSTVTVSIGGAAAVSLPSGITLSWNASGNEEILTDTFNFVGGAGSDYIVTVIRDA